MAEASHEQLGQYTLYELLGRGGMAIVNRAEMRGIAGFRKQVALKRLHPHLASDPSTVQSFVAEARLASHLLHPNVAQTYDLGKVDETYFIAMEYVAGPTLSQVLRQAAAAAGPVPIPISLSILSQICDALDYAHNLCDDSGKPLGIIHRDVSPSNIIVSSTGVVKLIDFGIAKAAGSEKTKTGLVKGKFSYMAPEYVVDSRLDLRADLFSLGAIGHELLTGRRLFQAKNDFDTVMRIREMPIQPPSRWNSNVPRDLDDIVLTALRREPHLRWQSASAMGTAIRNVVQALGGPITNQQVAEWIEWAFQQQKPKEDSGLVRVIDSLGEPTDPIIEPIVEHVEALPVAPAALVAPVAPVAPAPRTTPIPPSAVSAVPEWADGTMKVSPIPREVPAPHSSRRAWLLLLLLLSLALLFRNELVETGRALYEALAG